MSKSSEYANLVLDTGYLTLPQASGTITMLQTFKIDLKQVLGDIYNQFDTFAICLNSYAIYSQYSSYASGTTVDPVVNLTSNTVVKVGMTGLNWISSTLNGAKSNLCLFPNAFAIGGGQTLPDGGGYGQASFKNPNCIMFSKPPQPNVTLTVGLYNVNKNGIVRAGNSTGEVRLQINYNFSIFGIYDDA